MSNGFRKNYRNCIIICSIKFTENHLLITSYAIQSVHIFNIFFKLIFQFFI